MPNVIRSKTSGKVWQSPQEFYLDAVKHDPNLRNHKAEDLWTGAQSNPNYESLNNTEYFTKDPRQFVGNSLGNIPSSGLKFGANTFKSLVNLGMKTAETMSSPVQQGAALYQGIKNTPAIGSALYDEYFGDKGKYGNEENLLNTVRNDPVGIAGDVSTVASGIGGAARGAAMGASKLGATGLARGLTKAAAIPSVIGAYTDPLNAPNVALRATRAIPAVERKVQGAAEGLYKIAIGKSPYVNDTEKLRPGIKMALKEDAPFTKGGLAKMENRVDSYTAGRGSISKDATARGAQIDVQPIFDNIDEVKDLAQRKLGGPTGEEAQKKLGKLEDAYQRDFPGGQAVSPTQVHDKLKGQNEVTKPYYSKIKQGKDTPVSNAKLKAEVGVAKGYRESLQRSLDNLDPGLGQQFKKLGIEESHAISIVDEMNRLVKGEITGDILHQWPSELNAQVNLVAGKPSLLGAITSAKAIAKNPAMLSKLATILAKKGVGEGPIRKTINLLAASSNSENPNQAVHEDKFVAGPWNQY